MEIGLLLVVVVGWLIVRGMDRGEVSARIDRQDEEISRLREQIALLQGAVVSPVAEKAPEEVTIRPAAYQAPVAVPVALMTPVVVVSPPSVVVAPEPVAASVPPPPPPPPPPVPEPVFVAAERPSLEQRLGTNWLNRIGVTFVVFGVAFGLAYEVTHVGPVGRILLAYAVALVMLGGGLWLERKPQYRVFARAGIGGGWALGFLTTYAMYFFPATQVLRSQVVDLVLLFLVGVGMVVHSLRYRSQVVTGLAFLLAFSTVTISQVSAFSLLASAVLALGLEFVCVREEWYGLEIAGVVAAYGNHFIWLDKVLDSYGGSGHAFPLWGQSTGLLILFWAIFRVGYCVRKPKSAAAEGMSGLVAVLNSIGVMTLMKYQSFHPEYAFRALLALGAVEMGLAFLMRGRRRPAFAVLVTIASVLLVAAIPFRFHGLTWPLVWVLEGEALFVCGVMLRERLMRWLGMVVHLLVVAQMIVMHGAAVVGPRPADWVLVATTFFVAAAAMWGNAEWLGRREEETSSPYTSVLMVSSFAAALCALVGLWIVIPGWTLVLVWGLLALMLVEFGLRARSLGLRLEGYAVLVVAVARLAVVNLSASGTAGFDDIRLWAGLGIVAACLLVYERLGRALDVAARERSLVGGVAMWCASALVSSLLYMELPEKWLAAGWAGFALALAGAALVRDGARIRSKALILAVMVVGRALTVNLAPVLFAGESTVWPNGWGRVAFFTAVGLLAGAVPVGFVLRRKALAEKHWMGAVLAHPEQVFYFAVFALMVAWVPAEFHGGNLTMAWSGLGVAFFLVALAAGERSFRLSGLGLLLVGVAKLLVVDIWGLPQGERIVLFVAVGVALILVSFLYSRFGDRLKEYL